MPGNMDLACAIDHANRAQTALARYIDGGHMPDLTDATVSLERAYRIVFAERPLTVAIPAGTPPVRPVRAEVERDS